MRVGQMVRYGGAVYVFNGYRKNNKALIKQPHGVAFLVRVSQLGDGRGRRVGKQTELGRRGRNN